MELAGNSAMKAVRQPRLAEIVAAELREEILQGRLQDGSLLPNQDRLAARFGVSKASLREAMRTLEAENLVTVRRGKFGGVIVHAPSAHAAAYTLGLILQAEQVSMADFVLALDEIEPACAQLCARRADRRTAVVPTLRAAVAGLVAAVGADAETYSSAEQQLHDRIAELCGNATMKAVVGVLETLSAIQRRRYLEVANLHGIGPNHELRTHTVETQDRIVSLIEQGEADEVGTVFRWHRRQSRALTKLPYEDLIRVSVPNGESSRAP
jgi:GntR family transcriptional regulator, transcriptional repressor for pyruvate dehydrogenase complex